MGNDAFLIVDKYMDYFVPSYFIGDIFMVIGWKICVGLKLFCDFTQKLFDAAYQFISFTNDGIFKTFLGGFYPIVTAIFVISIIALGLVYMFSEKRPAILKNMLIGMAVLFVAPQMTDFMNDLLLTGKNAINGNTSVATQAVSSNVKDLKYIAMNNFDFNLNISENTAKNLEILIAEEHVKPSVFTTSLQKEVFGYVPQLNESGILVWKEVGSKGMFDIFDPPYYYRYSYQFLQIIVVLCANILIILFSSYSVVRMIWEIITTRVIGYITSLEITSGQKLKKCIEAFFNSYFILFLIIINIRLFQLAQQYINNKFPNWDQGLIRAFLIVFVALVVIDGPKLIEQLFGNDLGISHGSQKMMGLMRIYQQHQMQSRMKDNQKSQQKIASTNSNDSRAKMSSKTTSSTGSSGNNEPNVLTAGSNTNGSANNFPTTASNNNTNLDNNSSSSNSTLASSSNENSSSKAKANTTITGGNGDSRISNIGTNANANSVENGSKLMGGKEEPHTANTGAKENSSEKNETNAAINNKETSITGMGTTTDSKLPSSNADSYGMSDKNEPGSTDSPSNNAQPHGIDEGNINGSNYSNNNSSAQKFNHSQDPTPTASKKWSTKSVKNNNDKE